MRNPVFFVYLLTFFEKINVKLKKINKHVRLFCTYIRLYLRQKKRI